MCGWPWFRGRVWVWVALVPWKGVGVDGPGSVDGVGGGGPGSGQGCGCGWPWFRARVWVWVGLLELPPFWELSDTEAEDPRSVLFFFLSFLFVLLFVCLFVCLRIVSLVEFVYFVCTCMPGDCYRRQLRSLLLC